MNRRVLLPLALTGLVIGAGLALETTGRLGSRTGAGAAGGLGEYEGGCAGGSATDQGLIRAESNATIPRAGFAPAMTADGADAADLRDQSIPGRFVIKVTPQTMNTLNIDANGVIQTGEAELNQALSNLGVRKSTAVLDRIETDIRPTWHYGIEETLEFESDADLETVWEELSQIGSVEWVEPVYRVIAFATPNDPYFNMQWNMTGVSLPQIWPQSDGDGVVVAVIDTGVSNGGEDSFDTLLTGYDVIENDEQPDDGHGHGTHVAGTIAQSTDNELGVAGVAGSASILPVRVLDSSGQGSSTDVAIGIVWAADNGADVINLSLGANSYSQIIADACDYAVEQGVVVVAASGNDGFTETISYPAALESTIAVGATGLNHELAPYSNQGEELDIVAPGGDMSQDADGDGYADGILQETVSNGTWGYWFYQGTSMATPHVAGVAALLKQAGITDPDDVRSALTESAIDYGSPGWDSTFGNGLVDPIGALGWGADPDDPVEDPEDPVEDPGDPVEDPDDPVEDPEDPVEDPEAPVDPGPDDPDSDEPAPGPDAVEILGSNVKHLSPNRIAVRWRTNELSSSVIIDGRLTGRQDELVKRHRMFVRGAPGEVKIVTILSVGVDGSQDRKDISLTFGAVRH